MSKSTKKVLVGLLSLAMVLTVVSSVSAATFTSNLTVGSKGAEVTALQTVLAEAGYLTVAPTGYFGNLTKQALAKWQAANGISPAAGYFGPVTRAAFGGAATTVVTPGCSAGALFNSMTGASCTASVSTVAGCTAGALFSSITGQSCAGTTVTPSTTTWSADGTDGSITLSYTSYAPASQTLKKGDLNKPLISVKLQAVNGKTAVTRFDVHFSERPWLDFSSLSLTDSSGKVLATKSLSSSADATEVTVGSDYLVRFDAINPIVVTPGTDVIVAVTGNVLAASDKITGQTVYVAIPTGAVRTINGKGYTDSVGIGATSQGGAPSASYGNAVVLSSTGSTGTIYTRLSPSTPSQRIVVTSNTQQTTNVVLGVYSLKSANQASTLNSVGLLFNFGTSTTSYASTSLLSNVRLTMNGQTYGANSLAAGNTTFTNMSIPLAADTWVDMTITADIASGYQSNNISASSTLDASTIVGVDSNYNTVTLTSASDQTANDITFLQAGVNLSSPTATVGSVITGPVSGTTSGTIGNSVRFTFALTNTGNTNVYVSKTAGALVATTSVMAGVAAASASSTLTSLTVADTQPGDTPAAYVIQANGVPRTFTLDGVMKAGAGGGLSSLTVTGVYFNTTAANVTSTSTANVINFGLNALTVSAGY